MFVDQNCCFLCSLTMSCQIMIGRKIAGTQVYSIHTQTYMYSGVHTLKGVLPACDGIILFQKACFGKCVSCDTEVLFVSVSVLHESKERRSSGQVKRMLVTV